MPITGPRRGPISASRASRRPRRPASGAPSTVIGSPLTSLRHLHAEPLEDRRREVDGEHEAAHAGGIRGERSVMPAPATPIASSWFFRRRRPLEGDQEVVATEVAHEGSKLRQAGPHDADARAAPDPARAGGATAPALVDDHQRRGSAEGPASHRDAGRRQRRSEQAGTSSAGASAARLERAPDPAGSTRAAPDAGLCAGSSAATGRRGSGRSACPA